jgi:hypothetical protein
MIDWAGVWAQFLVGAFVQTAISVGLWTWGRSVARRRGGAFWRWFAWAPLVALGLSVVGTALSVWLLIRAFGAVSDGDPTTKATVLARGISEAMNVTAALVLPSWALYLASLIAFLVGTLRRR